MAKPTRGNSSKSASSSSSKPAAKVAPRGAAISKAPVKTEVRNTPIPKAVAARPAVAATAAAAAAKRVVTHDAIARRAYEIWLSGTGGSEFDNWCRAERELRG